MNQMVILFNKDGSEHVFAGTVKGTDYDVDEGEIIIRAKQLVTFASLEVAFDNGSFEGFNSAVLQSAANQSLQISYYKRELNKAKSREEILKASLAISDRQNETLERQLNNVTV